jgi:hypothetical protein
VGKRRTAAEQKAYRDRKRGRLPRPYRIRPVIEQVAHTFKIQQLVNHAYFTNTTTWIEPTSLGNMQIRLSSSYQPQWIEFAGILRFPLSSWEVLDGITDRWAVRDGDGRRYTRIYLLQDRRFGTRYSLGLAYRVENMTRKQRALKRRHKLIERIEGGKVDVNYVEKQPLDYVPKRRKNKRSREYGLLMREGKYHRLKLRLLHPQLKYYGKKARAMRRKRGVLSLGCRAKPTQM